MSNSTYPDYTTPSGWNALLAQREVRPSLTEQITADVVIVGAGFTGIACARRWHEHSPQDKIVLLDASSVGEGNPGRNSGFLLEIALAEDANPNNTERMQSCNALTRDAMATLVNDVALAGSPVDLVRAGTYRAAVGATGMRSLERYQAFLQAASLPHRKLDQQTLQEELGTDYYQAGLYSPDCYLAQPAQLIRTLASLLPPGSTLFEHTPATSIRRKGEDWSVSTPQGSINCGKLVLANNSFAAELGIAKPFVVPVFTYAGLTEPLSDAALDSLGSNANWGLLPMHKLGSTLRQTADGRLLIRSLHGYRSEMQTSKVKAELSSRLQNRFPQLGAIDLPHIWGGAVGVTYNNAPVWGELQPGLFVSVGCNGGGTVKGTLFGQLLADAAHGIDIPDVPALFGSPSWMPPEPLRGIGFHCSAWWQSWQGRQEL